MMVPIRLLCVGDVFVVVGPFQVAPNTVVLMRKSELCRIYYQLHELCRIYYQLYERLSVSKWYPPMITIPNVIIDVDQKMWFGDRQTLVKLVVNPIRKVSTKDSVLPTNTGIYFYLLCTVKKFFLHQFPIEETDDGYGSWIDCIFDECHDQGSLPWWLGGGCC